MLSPLVQPLDIMSALSVMPLIIACLLVMFELASIVTNELLVIISMTVLKTLPVEILILSPLLPLLEFPLLIPPLLR